MEVQDTFVLKECDGNVELVPMTRCIRLPTLKGLVQGAHKNGATSSRFRVDASEVARIRGAEKKGDGLRVVLEILRKRTIPESLLIGSGNTIAFVGIDPDAVVELGQVA